MLRYRIGHPLRYHSHLSRSPDDDYRMPTPRIGPWKLRPYEPITTTSDPSDYLAHWTLAGAHTQHVYENRHYNVVTAEAPTPTHPPDDHDPLARWRNHNSPRTSLEKLDGIMEKANY